MFREPNCGRAMIGLCSKKLFCTTRLPCERISCDVAHFAYRENPSFLLSRRENGAGNEPQAFCANKVQLWVTKDGSRHPEFASYTPDSCRTWYEQWSACACRSPQTCYPSSLRCRASNDPGPKFNSLSTSMRRINVARAARQGASTSARNIEFLPDGGAAPAA
jgi:hypothetical protein